MQNGGTMLCESTVSLFYTSLDTLPPSLTSCTDPTRPFRQLYSPPTPLSTPFPPFTALFRDLTRPFRHLLTPFHPFPALCRDPFSECCPHRRTLPICYCTAPLSSLLIASLILVVPNFFFFFLILSYYKCQVYSFSYKNMRFFIP